MSMQMLMKRGKRSVAKYFRDENNRQSVKQQLLDFVDFLLDPKKPIDDFETLDWCRWIIAGGVPFDEFSREGMLAYIKIRYYYLVDVVIHADYFIDTDTSDSHVDINNFFFRHSAVLEFPYK